MRTKNPNDTDISYAISVLLATGAVVETTHTEQSESRPWGPSPVMVRVPAWTISTRDGRAFTVTEAAMVELAHDEARRRRDDWQRTMDHVEQLAMFDVTTVGRITA